MQASTWYIYNFKSVLNYVIFLLRLLGAFFIAHSSDALIRRTSRKKNQDFTQLNAFCQRLELHFSH